MRKIENIVLSWDTFFGMIATIISILCFPDTIKNDFCSSIYGTAIAVLSIIFSIFFASLAVLMSFQDNEFIAFIERPQRIFSRLLQYFKITLGALFVSLVYTIFVYIYSTYHKDNSLNSKSLFCIFIFLFAYSLFATGLSIIVTLKLTTGRATFIANKKSNEDENHENEKK